MYEVRWNQGRLCGIDWHRHFILHRCILGSEWQSFKEGDLRETRLTRIQPTHPFIIMKHVLSRWTFQTSHFQPPSIPSTIFTSTRFNWAVCCRAILTHSISFIFMRFSVCFLATCIHTEQFPQNTAAMRALPRNQPSSGFHQMPVNANQKSFPHQQFSSTASFSAAVNVKGTETSFPAQYKCNAWGSN